MVAWGHGDERASEETFDEDDFAHVVSLDAVTDKLKDVPRAEQPGGAVPQIPSPVGQLHAGDDDRRQRQRDADQVEPERDGVLVAFEPVRQPSRTDVSHAMSWYPSRAGEQHLRRVRQPPAHMRR